jgi:DNA repair exonuclease SbcCD ATPase subunit
MSVLSSRKDYYIDNISNCEENLQVLYLKKIEKYILNDIDDTFTQRSEVICRVIQDNSGTTINANKRGSIFSETKLRKLNETDNDLKRDPNGSQFIDYDDHLMKKMKELEVKNQEYLGEIEALKKANEKKLKDQENFISESIVHNNLQHLLHLKENEINELKKEHEILMKRYVDENYRLKENVDILEEKILEFNDLKSESDKLKKKAKELEILKEKMAQHEKSVLDIQSKNSQIDALTKEKQNYIQSVDKLQKDIINEKEKSRSIENERRRLENELIDIKRENAKILKKLEDNSNDVVYSEKESGVPVLTGLKNSYRDLIKRNSLNLEKRISLDKDGGLEIGRAYDRIKNLEAEVSEHLISRSPI